MVGREEPALGSARFPSSFRLSMTGCRSAACLGELRCMNDPRTPSQRPPATAEELPLWEAALAWCDEDLVETLRSSHATYRTAARIGESKNPFPTETDCKCDRFFALADENVTIEESIKRKAAAKNVERNFCERIKEGKIALLGLRSKPDLAEARTQIPRDWVFLLKFDWENSMVSAEAVTFVGVTGRAVCAADWQTEASASAALQKHSDPTPRKPTGKPSYGPIIEDELQAYARKKGMTTAEVLAQTNRSQLARILHDRLQKNAPPNRKGGLPSVETVRKHVGKLAERRSVEKGGR